MIKCTPLIEYSIFYLEVEQFLNERMKWKQLDPKTKSTLIVKNSWGVNVSLSKSNIWFYIFFGKFRISIDFSAISFPTFECFTLNFKITLQRMSISTFSHNHSMNIHPPIEEIFFFLLITISVIGCILAIDVPLMLRMNVWRIVPCVVRTIYLRMKSKFTVASCFVWRRNHCKCKTVSLFHILFR